MIEGVAPFLHACWSGVSLQLILHSPILLQGASAQREVRRQRRAGVRTAKVDPDTFRSLSRSSRASGVLAVARQRWTALAQMEADRGLGRVVVDRIRNQGNLGTILRTATSAGIAGVVFLGGATDPLDPATVRASMGSIFDLELTRTNPTAFSAWARANDVRVIGTSPRAPTSYRDLEPHARRALVLGDERSGMSPEVENLCDECVSIPNHGNVDSLNVAVATGIVLFEMMARSSESLSACARRDRESSCR